MNHNPFQLQEKWMPKFSGILSYPINANVNLSLCGCRIAGQLESDDICVSVVIQIVLVDRQEIFIGAKDIAEGA